MSHHLDTDESPLDKPVPRAPKSPRHSAQIQAQNRRREYLARHPSYFQSIEHEFADPILYERLVKRYQTASEREAEGKAKGYGRTLEADLIRGETKLSNLKCRNGAAPGQDSSNGVDIDLEPAWERPVSTREEGLQLWHEFLEERFIKGQDEDFDYGVVDNNEDLDAMIRREAEDAWFDDEEPGWVAEGTEEPENESENPSRLGETGIQDF